MGLILNMLIGPSAVGLAAVGGALPHSLTLPSHFSFGADKRGILPGLSGYRAPDILAVCGRGVGALRAMDALCVGSPFKNPMSSLLAARW